MNNLKDYFNSISQLSENTWTKIYPLFKEKKLAKGEFFAEADKVANEIAFLQNGVVRAFFLNQEG